FPVAAIKTCRRTASWNARILNRRGAKKRNGTASSTVKRRTAENVWNAGGSWWKNHAVQGGSGCVSRVYCRAVRWRQVWSPLESLTQPEENIRRKSSHRSSHSAIGEAASPAPNRRLMGETSQIARKPVSSRR